jgi:hypothetical protein
MLSNHASLKARFFRARLETDMAEKWCIYEVWLRGRSLDIVASSDLTRSDVSRNGLIFTHFTHALTRFTMKMQKSLACSRIHSRYSLAPYGTEFNCKRQTRSAVSKSSMGKRLMSSSGVFVFPKEKLQIGNDPRGHAVALLPFGAGSTRRNNGVLAPPLSC